MRLRRKTHEVGGFTLVELMVAIGLLSTLGLMLIVSVQQVVTMTSEATARAHAMSAGAALLSEVESDLSQIHGADGGRLISGQDPMGRMFIAFVRTLPEERSMLGGYDAGAERVTSGYQDSWRGLDSGGYFRALGGLAEVCYVMEPTLDSDSLYRGIVAPISEPGPAGVARNRFDGVIGDMETWHSEAGSMMPAAAMSLFEGYGFREHYQLFAERVLYLGFEFWSDGADEWRDAQYFWESADDEQLWDELSGTWPRRNPDQAQLASRGLGYPRAIRVNVTIDYELPLKLETMLAQAVQAKDTQIQVQDLTGFPSAQGGNNVIRIGDEWVRYGAIDGDTLLNCKRGQRGTKAVDHTIATRVRAGLSMSRVVQIPVGR